MRAHSIDLVIEIGDRKIALIFVFIFESAVKNMAVDVADEENSRESARHVVRVGRFGRCGETVVVNRAIKMEGLNRSTM